MTGVSVEIPTSSSAFSSSYEEERDLQIQDVGERLQPNDNSVVLGAFEASHLVGVVGLVREQQAKLDHKAFLWGVYVAPAFRKRSTISASMAGTLSA